MFSALVNALSGIVTRYPWPVLLCMLVAVVACGLHARYLTIDVSSDSLMLENDPDLEYYREVHRDYGGGDAYIIVGFTPKTDVLDRDTVALIKDLANKFRAIPGVSAVTGIHNVPLLLQSQEDEETGETGFMTLLSSQVDVEKARRELMASPIYTDNLISGDLSTTAIKVDFESDRKLTELLQRRYTLLEKPLDAEGRAELEAVRAAILVERQAVGRLYQEVLISVREIVASVGHKGEFHLSGVPLISNDSKAFVVQDIKVFGVAILVIMVLVLWLFFRQSVWIFLALVCAALNVLLVSGITQLLGFQLTIISSNFVALLIIFSVALSMHVIIRYQEVQVAYPHHRISENIESTLAQIITPCFYMVLTSAIAFLSLVVSGINPVIVFGYIMTLGLFCAFLLAFTVLPALIQLIKPNLRHFKEDKAATLLENILGGIVKYRNLTAAVIIGLFVLNLVGVSQLTVENRFIDYFKKTTDIHRGLELIDRKLGGTVPLEILLEAASQTTREDPVEEDDEFGDYLEQLEGGEDDFTAKSYWYNRSGIGKIHKIHEYLEGLPQVGKVLSLSSTEQVFRAVNKGEALEDFHLSLVYSKLPENIRQVLVAPFVSADGAQARIVARIKDSDHTLIRNDLLNQIRADLNRDFVQGGEAVRLTGISVLYNNVLQSLFHSQIVTLGTVFLCILVMLMILFRNVKLAVIGTLPGVFTAFFILGLTGMAGIPLNIMTITIAAITIGIGVDYAIHYIHRYKKEFSASKDNYQAIHRSQTTVGKALYFTSITITFGFIILVLSNFMPSIYFGLLTAIAMLVSLLATFSIIPLLLLTMKPLKT